MENVDLAVLETAVDWIRSDGEIVLATVAKTWGSSPRPAGSMMVWRRDGQFEGSLSGGCIEQQLLEQFAAEPPDAPASITYGITKEQAVARGLPCGGEVTVVVERWRAAAEGEAILERLARRERVERVVDLGAADRSSIATPAPGARTSLDANEFRIVFEPKWRLLVIGAGQLSAYVTRFAVPLGYDVRVCDPRENYRDSWMADGPEVDRTMPDDFVLAAGCDAQTAVVALTHDPKLDDLAIMEALNTPAFYVGALGSSRTNGARRERLAEHFDVSAERLAFLSGPIGVDLNTRTAAEIALAVMTEITARRNGVTLTSERTAQRENAAA